MLYGFVLYTDHGNKLFTYLSVLIFSFKNDSSMSQ